MFQTGSPQIEVSHSSVDCKIIGERYSVKRFPWMTIRGTRKKRGEIWRIQKDWKIEIRLLPANIGERDCWENDSETMGKRSPAPNPIERPDYPEYHRIIGIIRWQRRLEWRIRLLSEQKWDTLDIWANISVNRHQIEIYIKETHDDQEWWQ
jgi:hypothetical protein